MKTKPLALLTLALLPSFFTPANADLKDGLVAHWSFDDCRATDNSGNGHDGTLVGNPQCVDGVKGKAFSFDGVQDFIQVNDESMAFSPSDLSISVWINPSATQLDFAGIVDKTHALDSQSGWVLQKAHNENLAYYFSYYIPEERQFINPYGNEQKITSEQGKWNYLSITKNKNQVVTYLNGVKQQEINYSSENVLQNTKPLVIGAVNGLKRFFNGSIDDLRIYNRALTEAEVMELYNGVEKIKETVQISGQIKLGTQAGKGVSLSGDGLAESCLTDENGKFNCKITKGLTGFLTPESKGVSFSPPRISVTDAQTNLEVKTPLVGTTTDSFPLNGVMTSDWVKLKTDKATWQVETSTGASDDKTAYEGRFSFGSAKIGANQTAAIETTINVTQAGQLSFARRVSSNPEHGVLNFEIAGKQKNGSWKTLVTEKVSGDVPWEMKSYALSVGQFKLRWTYTKDGAEAKGEDKAWIDAVSYPSSVKVAAKTCEGITAGTVKLMTIKNPTCDQLQAYAVWTKVIRPSRFNDANTFSQQIEGVATSNDTAMTYIEWGSRIYGYLNPLVGGNLKKESANKIVGDLSSQLHSDAFSLPCKAIADKAEQEACGTTVSQTVGLGFTLAVELGLKGLEVKDVMVDAFPYLIEKGLIAAFNLYNAGKLYEPTKQLNNSILANYFLDDYYKSGGKLETLRTLYKAKSTTMIDLVNALASNKSYYQPDGSLLNSPLNPFVSYDYYTTHEVIYEIEEAQKLSSALRNLKIN